MEMITDFACLGTCVEQDTFYNLTIVILNAARKCGGLSIVVICERFITYGANGVYILGRYCKFGHSW